MNFAQRTDSVFLCPTVNRRATHFDRRAMFRPSYGISTVVRTVDRACGNFDRACGNFDRRAVLSPSAESLLSVVWDDDVGFRVSRLLLFSSFLHEPPGNGIEPERALRHDPAQFPVRGPGFDPPGPPVGCSSLPPLYYLLHPFRQERQRQTQTPVRSPIFCTPNTATSLDRTSASRQGCLGGRYQLSTALNSVTR